ncbi:prolyl-tRNA synthetase associated domain-containing protein [Roseospirillum parvum]|uniref:Ala-tRNA(Pro) deacylase n=1 Tax=Roseospirillum parvum TaxID=83401 RepID=A0A1G7TJX3_9PROT|nr:prolyl-tRNA synthetase associated domain-containing protein [Roseospirillum parvum]SDG34969.1 Ala-tRNA(Pro) deacylase [Roseospirillum parvum]
MTSPAPEVAIPAPPVDRAGLMGFLEALGIAGQTFTHPPVNTVEEALTHWAAIPGVHAKNLFLKDAGGQLWLVVVPFARRVDLKALPRQIGSKRLSFGRGTLLEEVLGVLPGSVTPLAMINDAEGRVKLVLDAWMMAQPRLAFHPLENTATVSLGNADFRRFLTHLGQSWQEVDLGGDPGPDSETPAP